MNFSEPRFLRYTDADIAFGVIICLTLGVLVWQWHYPKVTQIQALRARLAEQQHVHEEVDQMQAVVTAARSEAMNLSARLAGYEDSVFTGNGLAGRLEDLSQLQADCGVELGSISPGADTAEQWYVSTPLTVIAQGSLDGLLCFVHRLENVMVAAEMRGLRFSARMEQEEMTASLDLRVLTSKESRRKDGGV